jgi:hypothetical protein
MHSSYAPRRSRLATCSSAAISLLVALARPGAVELTRAPDAKARKARPVRSMRSSAYRHGTYAYAPATLMAIVATVASKMMTAITAHLVPWA